jgi:hypothetical protein
VDFQTNIGTISASVPPNENCIVLSNGAANTAMSPQSLFAIYIALKDSPKILYKTTVENPISLQNFNSQTPFQPSSQNPEDTMEGLKAKTRQDDTILAEEFLLYTEDINSTPCLTILSQTDPPIHIPISTFFAIFHQIVIPLLNKT